MDKRSRSFLAAEEGGENQKSLDKQVDSKELWQKRVENHDTLVWPDEKLHFSHDRLARGVT